MSRGQCAVIVAAICVVTAIRVAATHAVFSPTYDEPLHVASGFEYLTKHRYTNDRSHPPIARIAFAFPLRHATVTATDGFEAVGEVYESAGDYMRGVAASRRGNLIFLVLAIIGVALWSVQVMTPAAAALASAIFALLPVVLAHAGLATTDVPGTAGFALAMAATQWWLGAPTWRRTLLLALAVGFGLVTKFSFPLFFAVGAVTLMWTSRRWPVAKGLAALAGALVIVDAVYLFKLPLFFKGIRDLMAHNFRGHDAYFLGQVRSSGWWYYFPVLLLIKTPLPALILAAIGAKRHRDLVIIASLMIAVTMPSNLNLGVRHIMPVYVPLSMLAALGGAAGFGRLRLAATLALLAWLLLDSALAHPDYLPWANGLAGGHPERIALDSNFDWGQDVVRLRDECRRRGITNLHAALFGMADLRRIGLPPTEPVDDLHPAPGWHAISESIVIPAQVRNHLAYGWLTGGRDFIRVGKSIRLYRVP